MTHSVILPYRKSECCFNIHLEANPATGRYIHEFRLNPEVLDWLAVQGFAPVGISTLYSSHTNNDVHTHLSDTDNDVLTYLSDLEVLFETADQAMLFKLTWA